LRITAKTFGHGLAVLALTLLTQIGGLAWLAALPFRRFWAAFVLAYALLWGAAFALAPMTGRMSLPCLGDGPLRSQSVLYCALNRHYVTPKLYALANDLAQAMDQQFPGTQTRTLDAGFPFTNLPLLPHLSHDDGEKLDLALFWQDRAGQYQPGRSKSPIGYWGYRDGPTDCPKRWADLRWDMAAFYAALPDWQLDARRMYAALNWLARDPRTGKVLIEPHIPASLTLSHPKIRFQGCRAARHDDHIHLQL
jgi:hypothetical protein